MEKRRRFRPTIVPTQPKRSPNVLKKACRDCNAVFTVGESTQLWFLDHGLQIPTRCQNCRDRRKQTAIKNTKATQHLTILQNSTTSRKVSNQTSYASVVTRNAPIKFPFSPSAEINAANSAYDDSKECHHSNERNRNFKDPELSQTPITAYVDDNAEARKESENSTRKPSQVSGAPATSPDSEIFANSNNSDSNHADHNPPQNLADLEDDPQGSKGPPMISSHSDDSSVFNESGSDSSEISNPNSSELPGLEEDSSVSSTHARFRDSQSESQESTTLPQLSEWRTIKDARRRRHLDCMLSHPSKEASVDAGSWTLKQFGSPSPGCYSSDMAELFYECFKARNNRFSACSAGQGD